jgi:hypothetical protein
MLKITEAKSSNYVRRLNIWTVTTSECVLIPYSGKFYVILAIPKVFASNFKEKL